MQHACVAGGPGPARRARLGPPLWTPPDQGKDYQVSQTSRPCLQPRLEHNLPKPLLVLVLPRALTRLVAVQSSGEKYRVARILNCYH